MLEHFHILLPEGSRVRLKIEAAKRNTSLSRLIYQALLEAGLLGKEVREDGQEVREEDRGD